MSRKRMALGLAAVAAGALAGAAAEELLARRLLIRPDPESSETIAPPDGETIDVDSFDGAVIHATTTGRRNGPALVFAHGIIESSAIWHYQMRDSVLQDRYSLIAYDARGHGRSGPARGPRGTTPLTSATLARDLTAVVERTTDGRVVLIGHSLGGIAIQALWDAELPQTVRDRVAGVVLVNTTFTAELAGWRGGGTRPQRAYERVEDVAQRLIGSERLVNRLRPRDSDLTMLGARVVYGRNPSPSHLAASVRIYRGTPSATIAASIDLATTDLYRTLPHIDLPTLVVAGTHDRITPPFLSEEIAARIPGAELVVLPGCGHIVPFERHEELNTLIVKFAATALGESSDGGARFSLGQTGVL